MKAIECKNISKRFADVQALDDVSFVMEAGGIYALLGRNGAGKTTLLNCICTRYVPDNGEVFLQEEPAVENPRVLGDICFMTEHIDEFDLYAVRRILKMAATFYPKWDEARVEQLLILFQIRRKDIYAALSKGRQAALGFIIGVCSGCSVVLFDEIYSGMDAVARKQMYELLLEEQERQPRTFVMSTHLIEEMAGLFTDVVMLDQGSVILADDMETIHGRSYKCVGREEHKAHLEGKNILSVQAVGSVTEYMIYDDFAEEELLKLRKQGMSVTAMTLQELFIAYTGGAAAGD